MHVRIDRGERGDASSGPILVAMTLALGIAVAFVVLRNGILVGLAILPLVAGLVLLSEWADRRRRAQGRGSRPNALRS
jgi:hypothetical protein